MLSMGKFFTGVGIHMQQIIRYFLRCAWLIGTEDDIDSLQEQSNILTLLLFVKKQVRYFPNSNKVMSFGVIYTGDIFYKTVV